MTTSEMDTAHNEADKPQRRGFKMTSRSQGAALPWNLWSTDDILVLGLRRPS